MPKRVMAAIYHCGRRDLLSGKQTYSRNESARFSDDNSSYFQQVVSHITSLLFCHQGVASQSETEHPLWVVMKTANATIGFPLGVNEVFSKQNGPT